MSTVGSSLTKQRCEHRVVETDLGRHFNVSIWREAIQRLD